MGIWVASKTAFQACEWFSDVSNTNVTFVFRALETALRASCNNIDGPYETFY